MDVVGADGANNAAADTLWGSGRRYLAAPITIPRHNSIFLTTILGPSSSFIRGPGHTRVRDIKQPFRVSNLSEAPTIRECKMVTVNQLQIKNVAGKVYLHYPNGYFKVARGVRYMPPAGF